MKTLILILFLSVTCFSQDYVDRLIFYHTNSGAIAADTVGSITLADSVEIQMGYGGQWKLLTSSINDTALITGDDKIAENTVQFSLAKEDYWTHISEARFRIYTTGQDTALSYWIPVGRTSGALTLDVVADTIGTRVDYGKTTLHGN